jgi:hypothetical protein
MKARILLATCLIAFSAGAAGADAPRAKPGPTVISKSQQPVGTPHKASSLAPHPTKRRVFGAPIQPPIVRHVAPKKPRPQ